MSYSLSVKAADKAAAKEAVAAKFDEMVVAQQPIHARDRAAVLATAGAMIDLLADDDTKDVSVSCNGHLSWGSIHADAGLEVIHTASVACSASYTPRLQDPGK